MNQIQQTLIQIITRLAKREITAYEAHVLIDENHLDFCSWQKENVKN